MPPETVVSRPFDYPAASRVRTGTLYESPEADGSGRFAVVVIHGLFAHRGLSEIELVCRRLAEDLDVVSVDLRGHGDAPGFFTWGREESRDLADLVSYLHLLYRGVGVLGF